MILLVILIYALIGVLEILPLVKENKKKELILFSVVFGGAFILSMLLNLNVKIPSPAKPIENIVEAAKGVFVGK